MRSTSRDQLRQNVLMSTAHQFARLSTCERSQVGCVLVKDYRIIATGYNGAPSGMAHCDHTCSCGGRGPAPLCKSGCPAHLGGIHWDDCPFQKWVGRGNEHIQGCRKADPCTTAIHAEANAIADAAKRGVSLQGADLFVTLSPCLPCAQLIVSAGIQLVYFHEKYRDSTGVKFLVEARVGVLGVTDAVVRAAA